MDLRFVDIPKIDNDTLLEDLSKDILKTDTNLSNVNVHGRPGQKQDGIDVFARENDSGKWIGIQCKVRSTNKSFSKQELLNEINQALSFNPTISKYYLYTTLNRDSKTQLNEREIVNNELKGNPVTFEIKFWEDIKDILRSKECESVYYRYYHKFFRDNKSLGHSIGKLINLGLQFDNKPDTKYEIILGKIPPHRDKSKNVDYFRDTYFIANLLDKTLEFFTKYIKQDGTEAISCYPSDIYDVFENEIDRYRIAKWLRSLKNIDDIIYSDITNYNYSITTKERWEYFDEGEEE
jgi:hypothetical protein